MHRLAACFFAVYFLVGLSGGTAVGQTEYSADIVDLQKPDAPVLARLYVTKSKRRIEFRPPSGDMALVAHIRPTPPDKETFEVHISGFGKAIILNLADRTSTIIEPEQKMYFGGTSWGNPGPSLLYNMYALLQPVNLEDACAEWMRRSESQGWMGKSESQGGSCKKSGDEYINGRIAAKYDTFCDGEICNLWIDSNLRTLVKRKSKWTSTELRNIREGPQPSKLFEIPDDYIVAITQLDGIIGRHDPE
jgi:hypothetical protein